MRQVSKGNYIEVKSALGDTALGMFATCDLSYTFQSYSPTSCKTTEQASLVPLFLPANDLQAAREVRQPLLGLFREKELRT